MSYPTPAMLNLALRSGDVVEVEAVRTSVVDIDRGCYRIEWNVREMHPPNNGEIAYKNRWEGSRRSVERTLRRRPLSHLELWIMEMLP